MAEAQRLDIIDIIKGIAIIMIVNVHLISGPFFTIGETFHVIAFFFTSGMVHALNEKWEKSSFGQFVKQRSTRLLYPYLMLSICYIAFHLILNLIRGEAVFNEVIVDALVKTVTLKGIGTLWFLPILFIGELLFFYAKQRKIKDRIIILAGFLTICLSSLLNYKGVCGVHWYGDHSVYGLLINNPVSILLAGMIVTLFIDTGYLLVNKYELLFRTGLENKKSFLIVTIICIVSFLIDFICIKYYVGDLHKLNIGDPLIYILCSVSGLTFICCLSLLISRLSGFVSSTFKFWGKGSLIIMTTHTEYYINSVVYLVVTNLLLALNINMGDKMLSGISLIIIMLLESGIVYIVNNTFLRNLYIFPNKRRKGY